MSECIRVLQVFAEMNRGGAENMIMNLYRKIDRKKLQFDFIVHTAEKCAFDDEIISMGGEIYRVPRYRGKNHREYINAWNAFFQKHREYQVLHSHLRSTAALFLPIAKRNHIYTVIHSHNTSDGMTVKSIIKRLYEYPLRYTADYYMACSKESGQWLFGKKIVRSVRFSLLKNAIDVDRFVFDKEKRDRVRKDLNLEDKVVIGHVGRFCKAKNHEFLIKLFAAYLKQYNGAVLLLAGEGVLKNRCEAQCRLLGIDQNVQFTGVRGDVDCLMQAIDVFVFPSLYEGYPVTLVEAQASGLPCVISDAITRDVVLTDEVRRISLSSHIDDWIAAIQELRSCPRSNTREIIRKMGYDIHDTADWLTDFYLLKAGMQ